MAGIGHIAPHVNVQKSIITPKLGKSLEVGETCYLLEYEWFMKFKCYIGYGNDDEERENPGPIDNSPLFKDITNQKADDIRTDLIEEKDYTFIPEEAWELLVDWYGIVNNQQPISRRVHNCGIESESAKVLVYQVELHLVKDFDFTTKVTRVVSRNQFVTYLEDLMKYIFHVADNTKVRMWCSTSESLDSLRRLARGNKSFKDEEIENGHYVILELQRSDGSWLKPSKSAPRANLSSRPSLYEDHHHIERSRRPGQCGLMNLGNTCFMNSVLQCLSNCPPLTEYFLENKYQADLYLTNPNGMKGELAKAYGELLCNMWSGKNSEVSPGAFKLQVSRYATQFSGFQQHDAQEFLTFLLDGLHEELNRIRDERKGISIESSGRSDKEVAQETWDAYLKRSNSIIVNTFHGLLKSRLVCPSCEMVSVKFDPLCYMTLPLPLDSDRVYKILHVPYDQSKKEIVYRVTISKLSRVRDLLVKLGEKINHPHDKLILAEVYNHHFHRFYGADDSLEKIYDNGVPLILYDIPVNESQSTTIVPVCHWESSTEESGNVKVIKDSNMFGTPFVVCLPVVECTFETVYNLVYEHIGRNFSLSHLRRNANNSYECNRNRNEYNGGENMDVDSENDIDTVNNSNEEIFSLFVVNYYTLSDAKKLPNDKHLIKFPEFQGRECLTLQWSSKSRAEFYKLDTPDYETLLIPQWKDKLNLQDCFSIFTTTEKLGHFDTWRCPKCKESQRATKKFDLWSLPNILIINLKRFMFTRYRRDKLSTNIEYPIENLRINEYLVNKDHPPVSYNLIGVINHFGSLGGGHYTAFAKNKLDNQWYSYDDASVHLVKESQVMSSAAYVLFYMKNENTKAN